MRSISLSNFSTGFVFIGIGVLALAIIALVVWVAVLSSRLKRVTDALMAHPEWERPAVFEEENDVEVEEVLESAPAAPVAPASYTSGAAESEFPAPGEDANTIDFDAAMMAEQQAQAMEAHAAEARAAAEAQAQAQAQAQVQAQAQAAAEAQAAVEAEAARQYAAQQRAAAAQQQAVTRQQQAAQAQVQAQGSAAAYPQAAYVQQQANASAPYNPAQQAYAPQQANAQAQTMQVQQRAALAAQQQAALAARQQAAMRNAAATPGNRPVTQNGETFLEQRQSRTDGYSFDEGASEFFENYRDDEGRHETSFGRKTPSIPFGTDHDVIEKREGYADAALSGEFDLDSIDFSKVAGYRRPTR